MDGCVVILTLSVFSLRQPVLDVSFSVFILEYVLCLDMLEDEHCLSVGGFDWAIFTYIFWAIFCIVLIC